MKNIIEGKTPEIAVAAVADDGKHVESGRMIRWEQIFLYLKKGKN